MIQLRSHRRMLLWRLAPRYVDLWQEIRLPWISCSIVFWFIPEMMRLLQLRNMLAVTTENFVGDDEQAMPVQLGM